MIKTYIFNGNDTRIIQAYELYKNTPLRWSINENDGIFCEVCSIGEYNANIEHYTMPLLHYTRIENKNYTIIHQFYNGDGIIRNISTMEVELYRGYKIIDIKDDVIIVNSNLKFIDKLK